MTVAAILATRDWDVVTVPVGTPVTEAVKLLAEKRIGAVPVLDRDGRVIGIMSERDIIYHLRSDGAAMLEWPVEKVMTSPAVTITREMSVLGALAMITRRRIRHLPVVEADRLVGLVSIGDLVKRRMDGIEQEAAAMREYIQSA
jgi:CBS domain-containing protein